MCLARRVCCLLLAILIGVAAALPVVDARAQPAASAPAAPGGPGDTGGPGDSNGASDADGPRDTNGASDADGAAAVQFLSQQVKALRWAVGGMIAAAPDLPYALLFVVDRLTGERDPATALRRAASLLAVLLVAMFVEWRFRLLFREFHHRLGRPVGGDPQKLAFLVARAGLETADIGVFALVATIFLLIGQPDDPLLQKACVGTLSGIILARLANVIWRAILSPRRASLRIPPLSDRDAQVLYDVLWGLSAVLATSYAASAILAEAGLPPPLRNLLGTILVFLVGGTLAFVIGAERRPLGQLLGFDPAITARRPDTMAAQLVDHWHVIAICLALALTLYAACERLLTAQPQGLAVLLSWGTVLGLLVADGIARIIVQAFLPRPTPADASTPEAPAAASTAASIDVPTGATATPPVDAPAAAPAVRPMSYADPLIGNLRIVLAVVGVLLLARIWDVPLGAFAQAVFGARIAGELFTIAITLLLASAVWGVARTAIARHLPATQLDTQSIADGEGGASEASRAQTLLPLLRNFLAISLVVIVVMIVISALGVNIGPLLAGAGVVGIAIGFGAQTLVRDIFSGIFFLIDDAFRTGEYIDVGSAKGVVERISIRSLRLRHHLGPINTVPFGEIRHVTNYSRDWAIMKLELHVPLDTDIEKVRKLVKKVGQELLAHPEHGRHLLQPLKSQGVHRMEPTAYVVRVKFMAKPGEQFVLRREVFRRLNDAFLANGIRLGTSPIPVQSGSQPEAAVTAALSAGSPAAAPAARTSEGRPD